jgi:hypothetical protein
MVMVTYKLFYLEGVLGALSRAADEVVQEQHVAAVDKVPAVLDVGTLKVHQVRDQVLDADLFPAVHYAHTPTYIYTYTHRYTHTYTYTYR